MNESQMPDSILSVFKKVKSNLESDHKFGHIEWIDRVYLWQAMNKVHGFGPSDCRRAVLCARTVWPLLLVWEQVAEKSPEMIPSPGYEKYPRQFLRDCTLVFLGEIPKMDLDTQETLVRKLDGMWVSEYEPIAAVLPAILDAGNFLLHSHIENVESEYEIEMWNGVLSGQYNDHEYDCCDWDDRDCFFYAAGSLAGYLPEPTNKIERRKQFWEQWLDDFVEVNVLPVDDLKSSLYAYLEKLP